MVDEKPWEESWEAGDLEKATVVLDLKVPALIKEGALIRARRIICFQNPDEILTIYYDDSAGKRVVWSADMKTPKAYEAIFLRNKDKSGSGYLNFYAHETKLVERIMALYQ